MALVQGGCLGGKGDRRGERSSNLPPKAQRCIWAGQIAALEGSDSVHVIGLSEENLRGLVSLFPSKLARSPPVKKGEPGDSSRRARRVAGRRIMHAPAPIGLIAKVITY